MIKQISKWLPIATFVVVVALALGLVGDNQSVLGNKTASFWDAASYKVSGTEIIDSSRNASFVDGTFSGGNLTVTTSNTATSTLIVGCIQMYATSTATSLTLQPIASTTAPTNGSGVIFDVNYGSCPI